MLSERKHYAKRILTQIGLSEKEIEMYLALLELGRGTVSGITKKANLNRTTGYDILEGLSAKGLVSISGKKPRQEYIAEDPKELGKYLEKEIEEKQKALIRVHALVSELQLLQDKAERSSIRFYEGEKGLEQVYEDTLNSSEEIRAFASVDDMHRVLPKYFPKYYQRRANEGIPIRAIMPETDIGRQRAAHDQEEKRTTVFVSAEEYYFTPEINIYDDKVMIASWRELLGIIIESAEIADAMKKIYELAWIGAKSVAKE